jgi:hypothetical protein
MDFAITGGIEQMAIIFAFSLLGAVILSLVACQTRRKKQRKKQRQHKLLKQIEFDFDNLRKLGDQIEVDMAITVKEDFELRRWWENYLSHPHEKVFRNVSLILFVVSLSGCSSGGTPQFYYSATGPAYTCNSIPWPFRCQMEVWYQHWPRPAPKRGKRYFDPRPGHLSHSEFANQGVEKSTENVHASSSEAN